MFGLVLLKLIHATSAMCIQYFYCLILTYQVNYYYSEPLKHSRSKKINSFFDVQNSTRFWQDTMVEFDIQLRFDPVVFIGKPRMIIRRNRNIMQLNAPNISWIQLQAGFTIFVSYLNETKISSSTQTCKVKIWKLMVESRLVKFWTGDAVILTIFMNLSSIKWKF